MLYKCNELCLVLQATALESDGIEYNDSELGIAFYEANPTAITGLYHTEILLRPKVLPHGDPAALNGHMLASKMRNDCDVALSNC